MSSNIVHCQLWMGGVEPYMTEGFIITAFQRMGENPLNAKVMRNKITGDLAGYCFVHFGSDEEAIKAMHKLNGKFIPNSSPPARFRLNNATSSGKVVMNEREFSLWVGDLTSDVDDYQLYRTFASRYESLRTAKVVMDGTGHTKGYGFLRFANEDEQKHCQNTMNGYKGLGGKPIKISSAVPKGHRTSNQVITGGYSSSQDYSQHYTDHNSYWQSYSAWQHAHTENPPPYTPHHSFQNYVQQTPVGNNSLEDDLELIDHTTTVDIDAWNREVMEQDYNLWDALESSKWLPVETYG